MLEPLIGYLFQNIIFTPELQTMQENGYHINSFLYLLANYHLLLPVKFLFTRVCAITACRRFANAVKFSHAC